MKRTIQFQEYLYIARKNLGLIAGIMFLTMVVSMYLNYYVLEPVYESSTTLIINASKNEEALDYGDIVFNREIVTTCAELVKSKAVTGKVYEELGKSGDYDEFAGSITVKTVKETGIIRIVASSNDAAESAKIANRLAFFFSKEASNIIGIDRVGIIEDAEKPDAPEKPRKLMNIGIATLLAAFTGLFWVFYRESVDNTILNSKDVEKFVGLSVIGVVPNFEKSTKLYIIREESHKYK